MFRLRYRLLLEHTVCLALLLVVALGAIYPVVVQGRTPVSANAALQLPPWEQARPAETEAPPRDAAIAERVYPGFAFIHASATRVETPLWNPLEFGGAPFLAVWRTRCLSPFTIPFYLSRVLTTVPTAFSVAALLKLLVAGLCGFYAARRLGFATPIALFVGISLELSGPILLWLNWPFSDVAPWFPLLFVFVEHLSMRHHRTWPLGAVVFALMLLGGEPEALAAAVFFGVFYLVVRFLLDKRQPAGFGASLGILALSVAVGAALVSIQLVPFGEFLRHGTDPGAPGGGAAFGPRHFVIAVLHAFFGGPSSPDAAFATRGLLCVGLVPILLAPLWLAVRPFADLRQRRRIESLILTSVFLTTLAMIRPYLPGVPGFRLLQPHHFLIGNAFAFTLLAAAAAEEWLALDADACARAIRRFALFAPLLVAVTVALVLWNGPQQPGAPSLAAQGGLAVGVAVALLALTAFTLLKPSVRIMGYGLCVLAAVDLFLAFQAAPSYSEPDLLFPETGRVATLRDSGERLWLSASLQSWPLAANAVPQNRGAMGVALDRYAAFLDQALEDPALSRRAGTPYLLLTKEDIKGSHAAMRPALTIEQVFPSGQALFRDLEGKGTAWLARSGRPGGENGPSDADSALPPLMHKLAVPGRGSTSEARIQRVSGMDDSGRRTVFEIEGAGASVLVFASAWCPGWRAMVDDVETPVGIVDGVFCGVSLEEGAHTVEFFYAPRSFTIGLIATACAAVIVLAAMIPLLLEVVRRRDPWRHFHS
ncbi:MAG: YfhO family protein [bacterium]|nr:YfhO family protein [bacterium]